MTQDSRAETLATINRAFIGYVPHNEALALEVVDYGHGTATLRLPYATHLVGHPETGVLHGGAITSLIDATCGAAVYMKLPEPIPIATLELRIDYLGAASPGRDVFARAECFHVTRNVAFVRAVAYVDDASKPIAAAAATFMLSTVGQSALERAAKGGGT